MVNVRLLVGGVAGYFVAALFNSVLAVIKELDEGIKEWIVHVFGHHWLGHEILTLLVFIISTGLVYSIYRGIELSNGLAKKLIGITITGTVLSILIIAGFNISHFLSKKEYNIYSPLLC